MRLTSRFSLSRPRARVGRLGSPGEVGRERSRKKTVVLYCGCCPWDKCPNVHSAYDALKKMGLSQLKVLYINQDLARDWVEKGLPTE